ncbi:hypothetical protein J416_00349 [Gracilibacillus halophilus YIM-C55.5]|uniref:FlgN family protein n=1 Tax=Gracilibacillus halophilus YIM-C55.5 TaxID=1308866 RepID=N4WZD3_9BACI|nr:flagellar protein FlgN [Gracilibacillus halophilus]ENH98391.1 hypothetical protein J416_00349 [Gracilibacillus halophilus YIM-C55.5]
MSVQTIISHLSKLIDLHHSLLKVSKKKTEVLKEGKIDDLQALLTQEQKHVQAVNQIEQKRIEAVEDWANANKLNPADITVSVIIEQYTEGNDKETLEKNTVELAEILMELRRQEDLNKQLTEQSLQFVQLSLDMIQPRIENFNYGNQQHQSTAPKRSVFDSKA